jgi:hypothetical protein
VEKQAAAHSDTCANTPRVLRGVFHIPPNLVVTPWGGVSKLLIWYPLLRTSAVAYLRLADKYLGLLASRLRGVNQPVIRTRRGFQPLVTHRWPAFERKVSAPNLSPPT